MRTWMREAHKEGVWSLLDSCEDVKEENQKVRRLEEQKLRRLEEQKMGKRIEQ